LVILYNVSLSNKYFSKILVADTLSKENSIKNHFKREGYRGALYIGDTKADYLVAKKIHMKSVLVCDGARDKNALKLLKPYRVVNKITDLKTMLCL